MGAPTPTTAPPRRRPGRPARRPGRGHAFLFVLLLVALLSVSLLLAAEVDSTLARREREAALLQVGHEFRTALARYQQGRAGVPGGQYPAKLDDLLLDRRYPATVRHLRRLYADPVTGQAEWGLVREGGRIVGVYSLSNLKPLKQDGFDPDDEAFRARPRYRDWVFTYPPVRTQPAAPATSATSATSAASAPEASFAPRPVEAAASQR